MEERIVVCMYRRATPQDCFGDGRLREQVKELLVRSKVRGGAVCGWCHNTWFHRTDAERADAHAADLKGLSNGVATDGASDEGGIGGCQLTFCFPSSDVQQALSFVLDPEAQSLLQGFCMGVCQGMVDVLAGDESVQLGVGSSIDAAWRLARQASEGQVLADDAVAQALGAAGQDVPYEALLHGFCDAHGSNVFVCVMKGQGTVATKAPELPAAAQRQNATDQAVTTPGHVVAALTNSTDNPAVTPTTNQGKNEPLAVTQVHNATAASSAERRQLRSQAMAALARGEGEQAMAMLQSCCERSKDASALERSRDRLALAIGYSHINMAHEALENALYALARARESADATAERACTLFLHALYEAECPEEAARW